jgi:collagenase-like PrtC family protease
MAMTRKIELLAPAKNLECGIAAVDHGADAVYIGAAQFSARSAAGNSIDDIRALVDYAHRFRVKVYVAINTILTDEQLPHAEQLIHEVYNAGADAIIIQDMGILKLNLPPIAIHASTQTDNRTLEKVQFLEASGFSRVVLARELSLNQIAEIASNSSVELEVFVHGALCVSFSGQCYISQAMSGRSSNRGECAQYCRLPYELFDGGGNRIKRTAHWLSLKDLDLSDSLQELLEAGVTSLKIEGRLKDLTYVKNITSHYRQLLDQLFATSGAKYRPASSGTTRILFEPDPEKSFRRSATDYFLHGRHAGIFQPETPKSLGEPIGAVLSVGRNFLSIDTTKKLHNADGLCFIDDKGELQGFLVNTVETGGRVYPNQMPAINPGVFLFRNQDHQFGKLLKGKTAQRKIAVDMVLSETSQGVSLQLTDEDQQMVSVSFDADKQEAQRTEGYMDKLEQQLAKLGTSCYEARSIKTELEKHWFFSASVINEWRRTAVEALDQKRAECYVREKSAARCQVDFPVDHLNYRGNVTNHMAEAFYKERGVTEVLPGFEVKAEKGVPLMFTKHCIRYELGWCPRLGQTMPVTEPLLLKHANHSFRLEFDCKQCEMRVYKNEG